MISLQYPIKELPEPFQSMATGGGNWAFKPIITQGFGENAVSFYAQLGLKGHNGIDYVAPKRTKIYAAHDGKITKTYDIGNSSRTIGYGVWITNAEGWQTVYYHLDEVLVKVDDEVKAGDLIAYSDNTGEYTTGDHLHFGLYPAKPDLENGYNGAIDPTEFFNLINNNIMLKVIRQINTKDQYILGNDNKRYLIYNLATRLTLIMAGAIGEDIMEIPDVTIYSRGSDIISAFPE